VESNRAGSVEITRRLDGEARLWSAGPTKNNVGCTFLQNTRSFLADFWLDVTRNHDGRNYLLDQTYGSLTDYEMKMTTLITFIYTCTLM